MTQEEYAKKIADAGIRPSVQRLAIFRYLSESREHPTVDMVYRALSPQFPSFSRTTVYNTLKTFIAHKLINEVTIADEEARFDADLSNHFHFKCNQCGKIEDVKDSLLPDLERYCASAIPDGAQFDRLQVNVWGLCAECAKKAQNR